MESLLQSHALHSIPTTTIHLALQRLLATYQSELAESQRDHDTRFIEYWDSACQTIYDVAAALNISLEEQPSKPLPYKQRPHQPDSLTPLGSVDVHYATNRLAE